MDMRNLRYFHAITLAGSFSAAAEAVYVSQPALSLAIKSLEKDLGCSLFQRGRVIKLTPAGQRLAQHCEKIFTLLQDVRDDLSQLAGGLIGTVRPAILESLLLYLLPDLLASFAVKYPQVQFQFALKDTTEIEQLVLSGACQFGLVSRPPSSRKLTSQKLASFPHRLYVSARLKGKPSTLLQDHPLFLLGNWQREVVEKKTDLFARHPHLRTFNPINHVAVVRQLVSRGMGTAILPGYVDDADLRVLESFPSMPMHVYLIKPVDQPMLPATKAFIEFLRASLGKRTSQSPGAKSRKT